FTQRRCDSRYLPSFPTRRSSDLLGDLRSPLDGFAVKPLRGSGGKGIIIISGRDGDNYLKPSGKPLSLADIRHDISNILSGVYSLDRKITRLNSSHVKTSSAVFCL